MLATTSRNACLRPSSRVQAVKLPLRVSNVRGRSLIAHAVVEKEKVLEDVRSIIAQQLGTELEKVSPDAKFVDLGADSLDTVEIMMALEEKFELTLDEEGAEKISTVQEAADMIAAQIASK